jgi:two-component system cell cycle response regulator CpdR
MEGNQTPRILIVEDDDTVRGFLERALESCGCLPLGVPNGEAALAAISEPPGVAGVLIDGILPDMHGFHLAQRIVAMPEGRFVAVCFVTGALRESSSFDAGVGALSKPVRLDALRGVVQQMLAWRSAGGSALEARQQALRRIEQAFLVGP